MTNIDKVKFAIFNAEMEGYSVPQFAIEDGYLLLEGKVTADELVQRYIKIYTQKDRGRTVE